jgi:hypothetical protein
VVFYCGESHDWAVFDPIRRFLPPVPVVAKNRSVQRELRDAGVDASLWPSYPGAVIMARHALHRFPLREIVKIGLRHGAYHFKQFIRPERYNAFDLFVFTSEHEVRRAREHGIRSGVAGGFPKLDPLFQPDAGETAADVGRKLGLVRDRPTVLVTATWDRSGMSAIDRWCDRLHALTTRYNTMVTVHPATSRRLVAAVERQPGVHFIRETRMWPYLLLADVMVGDTSSILAEFCALDKPIITFRIAGGRARRMPEEIVALLGRISTPIDSFDELEPAIERSLAYPGLHSESRRQANALMFDVLDGNHGRRTAAHILDILSRRGIPASAGSDGRGTLTA